MSDSGFSDEARRRARVSPVPQPPDPGTPRRRRRRPSGAFIFFLVVVLVLLGLAGWAWAGHAYTDDLVAYDALGETVSEMDRDLTPLGHSEIPPCRDSAEGVITRTYPESTGPQAAEVIGYLEQKGWTDTPADPPAIAHLTRMSGNHELTIDIVAPKRNQLVASLTGRSPASALACLIR